MAKGLRFFGCVGMPKYTDSLSNYENVFVKTDQLHSQGLNTFAPQIS